jgi:hypothetical protein
MLTQENDVEIHALAKRGWNQSAISRHTGRDRKTVRKYLAAGEMPVRERASSCLEPWRSYIEARFGDDAHLEASVLHRELADGGSIAHTPRWCASCAGWSCGRCVWSARSVAGRR